MIHLAGSVADSLDEINILAGEGVDGIIVENYHGEISDMEDVLKRIKDTKLIVGLNVLPNEYKQAFEMADKYDANFIQLDYVAGRYLQHGGSMFSSIKYNFKEIDHNDYIETKNTYPKISVLGGVHPKYYTPAPDSNIELDIKQGMERAEAIVVTGDATGKETPLNKIKEFRIILGEHPLIIGAGLTPKSVAEQLSIADGAIVGSTFKQHGITTQKIQRNLVTEFMNEVKKIRNNAKG